ncbi:MAG: quinone oxidoreductase [Bifidobacteriaceae bacterium]|nr:quinone oxidoreductase [Bifidobacteriaceae bacterium]
MRAIQAVKPGPASVLRAVDLPQPKPGPGQVLAKVAAAGVNFIDTYRRSGVYKVKFPHVPGSEGSGTVEALGPDVTDLAVGDKIAWATSASGSYAEYALVEAAQALPVPPGLDLAAAAALPLQGMTADYLVRAVFPVGPNHTAVLYAAAGGVGQLATQMILASGAHLIAVTGSAEKAERVVKLGVDPKNVIVLSTLASIDLDLPQAVRDLTGGLGAHVVYDSIGRDTFAASLSSLRRRGTLVLFGGSSGQVPPFDPQELNAHGSLYLTRPTLADYTATRQELLGRAGRVFSAATAGSLRVTTDHRFALAEAATAHQALEARRTAGKVLLVP